MLETFRHPACHVVKSLQLIWGLGTHITHLRVPDPQTGCIHLKIGHQDSSSSYDHQSHISSWDLLYVWEADKTDMLMDGDNPR